MTTMEILNKYTAGEMTLEEANAALKKENTGFHLDPQKNVITEEEMKATTVGAYPEMANGYGLLDTGTGSFDKVRVANGFVQGFENEAGMMAFCLIGGKLYKVDGNVLCK